MKTMQTSNSTRLSGTGVTPHRLYRVLLILLVIGAVGWYGVFQARNLIQGPSITLTAPDTVVHDDRMITIEGNTKNIASLTLNGRNIFTDESGTFSEKLVLENGYTIMTLRATDRYGRRAEVSRPFIYATSMTQ